MTDRTMDMTVLKIDELLPLVEWLEATYGIRVPEGDIIELHISGEEWQALRKELGLG